MNQAEEQRTVTISRRLRPIRLGFLVPPTDTKLLRRVIQINTCLWGGRFNPILPFFKKTPSALIEGRYKPSARSIIEGYIEGFLPDYLVVKDKASVKSINFPGDRIIALSEVFRLKKDEPFGFGLEASYVYDDLYEKEFKFQRRHPIKVILPYTLNKDLQLFYATFFGEFPPNTELAYLAKLYKDSFGAEEKELEPSQFFKVLFERPLNPILAGNVALHPQNPERGGPQLFFMDANSSLDLMDFWNLRVTGRWVVPIPAQLAEYGIDEISTFVARNHFPDQHNKDWMHHTTIICSRSSKIAEMEQFIKKLKVPPNSLMGQHWYPRIWDEWARAEANEGIGTLTVKEDTLTVVSSGGRISFSNLRPDFIERVSGDQTPNWINVISISQQGELNGAPVIPPGISNLDRILHEGSIHPKWATTEGIIVPCLSWHGSQFWELPTSINLFKAYMEQFGYQMEVSSAGKITLQILRAVGGIWGIMSFESEEVLRKLEEMAHGLAESDDNDPADIASRKTRASTVSHKTWWGILQRINGGNARIAENHLKNLLKSGVFRRGLRLQCPKCSQHSWFSLEQLNEKMTCERCLQLFSFPMSPPSDDSWHYRTVGPFSIEGYAHGSYCTLLTANFLFGHHLRGKATWIPSSILKNPKQDFPEIEVDFAAFWQLEDYRHRSSPMLVLGECKTFDQFKAKDVKRMETLATNFPGSIIVFSTLRKKLEDKEKRLIASLAKKGRSYIKGERWRNPVMILTGIELLNRMGPPSCWKDAGMPYEQFEIQYWQHKNPQDLCDLLQQMHLGMESHHIWREKERRKRHQIVKSTAQQVV